MLILVFMNLVFTSSLEKNKFKLLYGHLDNIDMLENTHLDVFFKSMNDEEKILCKVVKYKTQLHCALCKQTSKILCRIKNDNECLNFNCIDCCNSIKASDTFLMKLNGNYCNSLISVYVTGKIEELCKFDNIIFTLIIADERKKINEVKQMVELNEIKKDKLFTMKNIEFNNRNELFVFSTKFPESDYKHVIQGFNVNNVCYKFRDLAFKGNKKNSCHYVVIEGFKIKYNSNMFSNFCSISRKFWETCNKWFNNNKNRFNGDKSKGLSFKFKIFLYIYNDDEMASTMADVVLKTYLLIYTEETAKKYPTFDPFICFKEYESLVTSENIYDEFMTWLMSYGKSYSVLYSCDKVFGSVGLYENLKDKLYSKEILETIRKECKKIQLFNYYFSIDNSSLLFVLYFERIISQEEQKTILFHVLNYFINSAVNYGFSVTNTSQMYVAFEINKPDCSKDMRSKLLIYLKKKFKNLGLTKIKLDYKKNENKYTSDKYLRFRTYLELNIKKKNIYESNKAEYESLEKNRLTCGVKQKIMKLYSRDEKDNLPEHSKNLLSLSNKNESLKQMRQCLFNTFKKTKLQNDKLALLKKNKNFHHDKREQVITFAPNKINKEFNSYGEKSNTLTISKQTVHSLMLVNQSMTNNFSETDLDGIELEITDKSIKPISNVNMLKRDNDNSSNEKNELVKKVRKN